MYKVNGTLCVILKKNHIKHILSILNNELLKYGHIIQKRKKEKKLNPCSRRFLSEMLDNSKLFPFHYHSVV